MELNHLVRLCRPFPFHFGFRAISHTMSASGVNKFELRSPMFRFIKSLPRKNR
jgi:hypothetical protein